MSKVILDFGNTKAELKYNFGVIRNLERNYFGGKSLIFVLQNQALLGYDVIGNLLYVGLKTNMKKITQEKVDEMVSFYLQNGGTMTELIEKIREALAEDGIITKDNDEEDEADEALGKLE